MRRFIGRQAVVDQTCEKVAMLRASLKVLESWIVDPFRPLDAFAERTPKRLFWARDHNPFVCRREVPKWD
jgi:hypothetical protein